MVPCLAIICLAAPLGALRPSFSHGEGRHETVPGPVWIMRRSVSVKHDIFQGTSAACGRKLRALAVLPRCELWINKQPAPPHSYTSIKHSHHESLKAVCSYVNAWQLGSVTCPWGMPVMIDLESKPTAPSYKQHKLLLNNEIIMFILPIKIMGMLTRKMDTGKNKSPNQSLCLRMPWTQIWSCLVFLLKMAQFYLTCKRI